MSVLLGIAVAAVVTWIAMVVLGRSREAARVERIEEGDRQRVESLARLIGERPGGAADRPLRVESPAEIEPRVEREPCPWCAGTVRVDGHEATEHDDRLLRRIIAKCTGCGRDVVTWFHVRAVLPN